MQVMVLDGARKADKTAAYELLTELGVFRTQANMTRVMEAFDAARVRAGVPSDVQKVLLLAEAFAASCGDNFGSPSHELDGVYEMYFDDKLLTKLQDALRELRESGRMQA